jgi:hypothetical protein
MKARHLWVLLFAAFFVSFASMAGDLQSATPQGQTPRRADGKDPKDIDTRNNNVNNFNQTNRFNKQLEEDYKRRLEQFEAEVREARAKIIATVKYTIEEKSGLSEAGQHMWTELKPKAQTRKHKNNDNDKN